MGASGTDGLLTNSESRTGSGTRGTSSIDKVELAKADCFAGEGHRISGSIQLPVISENESESLLGTVC